LIWSSIRYLKKITKLCSFCVLTSHLNRCGQPLTEVSFHSALGQVIVFLPKYLQPVRRHRQLKQRKRFPRRNQQHPVFHRRLIRAHSFRKTTGWPHFVCVKVFWPSLGAIEILTRVAFLREGKGKGTCNCERSGAPSPLSAVAAFLKSTFKTFSRPETRAGALGRKRGPRRGPRSGPPRDRPTPRRWDYFVGYFLMSALRVLSLQLSPKGKSYF